MSSEDIYKPNDFYRIRDRGILKDGHSMLMQLTTSIDGPSICFLLAFSPSGLFFRL